MSLRLAKKSLKKLTHRLGFDIVPLSADLPADIAADSAAADVIALVRPYTMTSVERTHALVQAVRYVVKNGIEGDFVECGVWRGGSMMAMAKTLQKLSADTRRLHLFDTFEGMPPPTEADVDPHGRTAQSLMASENKADASSVWCVADLDSVRSAVLSTGYDASKISFVKGRVEDTLPGHAPNAIAILRLDTDWYESTRHELVHLFPRLAKGGVLIIDDYGHWQGARRAVDEYFAENGIALLLNRIDETGRMAIK